VSPDEQDDRRADEVAGLATAVASAIAEMSRESAVRGVPAAAARAGASLPGVVLGWIGVVDEDSRLVQPVATWGRDDGYASALRVAVDAADPMGKGPTALAIRGGQPVAVDADDPRLDPWRDEIARRGLRSVASLPLRRPDGSAFGALVLWSERPGAFDPARLALYRAFVESVSVAFEAARLRELLAAYSGRPGGDRTAEPGDRTAELEERNTALSEVNDTLIEASRLKSEFLANMSHELRSPLTAIIGFAEVLHEELYGSLNARQKEHVGMVWDAGKRLLSLLEDILDLSRVEAGRSELDLTENYPRQIAESVIVMVQQAAFTSGVRLDWTVAQSAEMPVMADARKVKQALVHLLGAAVKRAGQDGEVALEVDVSRDSLLFAVKDSGLALSPDDPTLFRPFSKVETKAGSGRERMGVGLALARGLAELHGGRITMKNNGGDRGNVFTLELPIRGIVP
jgi:signal transduction histidine kinase